MYGDKPTIMCINNFSKFPIYSVDFGNGIPIRAIPHNLGDSMLIWPAPPEQGGLEIYFASVVAHAVNKLSAKDPWLEEMRQFSG